MSFFVSKELANRVDETSLSDEESYDPTVDPIILQIKNHSKQLYTYNVNRLKFKQNKYIVSFTVDSNTSHVELAMQVNMWDRIRVCTSGYQKISVVDLDATKASIKSIERSLSGLNYIFTIIIDKE